MARDEIPTRSEIWASIENEVLSSDDIAYTHTVFAQCFLPVRSLTQGTRDYQVTHGRAFLNIEAGKLVNPGTVGELRQCEVPAGAKARILFAYINDQAVRGKSPVINLGTSMRHFMEHNGVPVGGRNGKEVTRQLENIAAARVMVGTWGENHVSQIQTQVAKGMSFWLEAGNPDQALMWQPEMQLSGDYFDMLCDRAMPLDFRALVALQASPRAMDVYSWLAYRLHSVRRPVKIRWTDMHAVFGAGISSKRKFKQTFIKALKDAYRCYPEARVEVEEECFVLLPSPRAVPTIALRNEGGILPRGHGPKQGSRKKPPKKLERAAADVPDAIEPAQPARRPAERPAPGAAPRGAKTLAGSLDGLLGSLDKRIR